MLENNNAMTFTDYYSHTYIQPTQKTSTTLTQISAISNSTGIFGQFSRPLNPKDSLDTVISPGLSSDLSFAYLTTPGKGFNKHNKIGIGLITFGETNSTSMFIRNAGTNPPYLSLDQNFYLGWEFSSSNIIFTFNVRYK